MVFICASHLCRVIAMSVFRAEFVCNSEVDTNFLTLGPPRPVAPEIHGLRLSALGQGTNFTFFQGEKHIKP